MPRDGAYFNSVLRQISANQLQGTVDLTGQALTSDDAISLAQALRNNTSISRVIVTNNQISAQGVIAIADIFVFNPRLTWLYLNDNPIGDVGRQAVIDMVAANPRLGLLALDDLSFSDAEVVNLSTALQSNTYLIVLALNRNQMGDNGAAALARVIRQHPALEHLQVSGNQITGAGIAALLDTPLTTFLAAGNNWDNTGVDALIAALANPNCPLVDFRTGNHLIFTTSVIQRLATALITNRFLTSLSLVGVGMDSDGATALANALASRQCGVLKYYDFHGNSIGDQGAQAFIQVLQNYYPLLALDLSGNSISQNNLDAINQLINRNLQYPQFTYNKITLAQGETKVLTNSDLQVESVNQPTVFNVTQIQHGVFFNNLTEQIVTQFTQTDINQRQIKIFHDGSAIAPSYRVSATRNGLTTPAYCGNVLFVPATSAPRLAVNDFSIDPGVVWPVTTSNLLAKLHNETMPLVGLIIHICNLSDAIFYNANSGQVLGNFSQDKLLQGSINLISTNNNTPPIGQISVSDGVRSSPCSALNVNFKVHPTEPAEDSSNSGVPFVFIIAGIIGAALFAALFFMWRRYRHGESLLPTLPSLSDCCASLWGRSETYATNNGGGASIQLNAVADDQYQGNPDFEEPADLNGSQNNIRGQVDDQPDEFSFHLPM